jgi:pimeloyl-ACP methyl ester carboxylesterase
VPHFLRADARAELPDLSFHRFEESGHTPQLEKPELFLKILLR